MPYLRTGGIFDISLRLGAVLNGVKIQIEKLNLKFLINFVGAFLYGKFGFFRFGELSKLCAVNYLLMFEINWLTVLFCG